MKKMVKNIVVACVVLWAIVYGIIALVQWIFANWIVALCILGGVVLVGVIVAFMVSRD